MKLEDFIAIFEAIEAGKEVLLPYQLHKGLTEIINCFGSVQKAKEYFIKVKDASAMKIGETKNGI